MHKISTEIDVATESSIAKILLKVVEHNLFLSENRLSKIQQLIEAGECSICCNVEDLTAIIPCCNVLMCSSCLYNIKNQCPFCRGKLGVPILLPKGLVNEAHNENACIYDVYYNQLRGCIYSSSSRLHIWTLFNNNTTDIQTGITKIINKKLNGNTVVFCRTKAIVHYVKNLYDKLGISNIIYTRTNRWYINTYADTVILIETRLQYLEDERIYHYDRYIEFGCLDNYKTIYDNLPGVPILRITGK